jgi:UrcA family protein
MQFSLRTFSIALGAAALSLGFSAFAAASDLPAARNTEQVTTEVSYKDLNLAKAGDANELYARIERAAHDVCHVGYGIHGRAAQAERQCAAKAIDDAVHSVDNPNLTTVYLAKSGKRAMVASSR